MAKSLMYSGRDLMSFSPLRTLATRTIFTLADWLGFWRYPADLDIDDLASYWHMAYWFYLAERPVTRAVRGSGLEEHFARQRQVKPGLPPDFEAEIRVQFSAVGDLMCNPALDNMAGRYYEKVADLIFNADIAFANLESSLTSAAVVEPTLSLQELPKINASAAQYEVIKGHQGRQYSLFQLANNHILDNGLDGIQTTLKQLAADGIPAVGVNLTEEDQKKGQILEVKGLRLGFVAATYGVNGRPFPAGMPHLVNVVRFHQYHSEADLTLLEEQIAWCRQQGCDLVIAGLHWGVEWEFYPRPYQLEQAHRLAEAGADVIIGHHAHVIQPMEWYRPQRDPERLVPIFYGLGNLVAIITAPWSALSLVAQLTLTKGRLHGKTRTLIEAVQLTPVIQINEEKDGLNSVWLEKLQPLPPFQAQTIPPARHKTYTEAARYAQVVLGPPPTAKGVNT